MARFMIDISLRTDPDAEFFASFPLQRAHIERLLDQEVVMGYSFSLDRAKLWITMNAGDKSEAAEILSICSTTRP